MSKITLPKPCHVVIRFMAPEDPMTLNDVTAHRTDGAPDEDYIFWSREGELHIPRGNVLWFGFMRYDGQPLHIYGSEGANEGPGPNPCA